MAWLWMLAPAALLLGALALWRATSALAAEQRRLQSEIEHLGPLGAGARSLNGEGRRLRAAWHDQVHR